MPHSGVRGTARVSLARGLDERGQVLIVVALLFVGVLAGAALAIDSGRFKRDNSRLQQAADAAALAGARNLPNNPGQAVTDAQSIGNQNLGQGISGNGDQMSPYSTSASVNGAGDTITVTTQDTRTGKIIDLSQSGTLKGQATAVARVAAVNSIDSSGLQPLIVNSTNADPSKPGWGAPIDLKWDKATTGTPGDFGIVDMPSGTVTAPTTMSANTGAGKLHHVMCNLSAGQTILVPVYKDGAVSGQGTNATYQIIGFAALVIDSVDKGCTGNVGEMHGHFVNWTTQASGSITQTNYGLRSILLIG